MNNYLKNLIPKPMYFLIIFSAFIINGILAFLLYQISGIYLPSFGQLYAIISFSLITFIILKWLNKYSELNVPGLSVAFLIFTLIILFLGFMAGSLIQYSFSENYLIYGLGGSIASSIEFFIILYVLFKVIK